MGFIVIMELDVSLIILYVMVRETVLMDLMNETVVSLFLNNYVYVRVKASL